MNSEQELQNLEKKLYAAADKMRGAVPVSSYKFIVLGLIFLKYISDSFEERYNQLVADGDGMEEDRDSYTMDNIFYVPAKARWEYLNAHSKDHNIGQLIDEALDEIEKENPTLKGVLIKEYNSPDYRNVNLGELIDLFTNIKIGSKEAQDKDILGRIYEYFLGQFASNELQKGGEFYTPACLVRTMVEIIEPFKGRVYDPACGSGGMFVQSTKFIERHQGKVQDLAIYGQEKNPTTWKLAKMNLAIRSLNGDLGKFADDTFQNDLHKGLKADYVLANPPFNISDWGQEKLLQDPRWRYGIPPKGNANYAWIQHMISKLSQNGKMACILANGSLDSSGTEYKIRKEIIDADLVDCIITLPSNLFYTVAIPCSIWIINRNKMQNNNTLFIDARNIGKMVTKTVKEFSEKDIMKIANCYHKYQLDDEYKDEKDFCKKTSTEEIINNNYVLTPGTYIETQQDVSDLENKKEKLTQLIKEYIEEKKQEDEINKKIERVMGELKNGI